MNYIGREPAPSGVILVGDSTPVGMIAWYHAPPTGWLRLNGAVLLKASYPDLWAYAQGFLTLDQGVNPGLYRDVDAANFALPKLDGLFIRAAGQVDANHIAGAVGAKQADDNLAHRHNIDRYNNPGANTSRIAGGGALQATIGDDVALSGGTEARPVNVALLPCVKALATTLIGVQAEAGAYAPGTLAGFGMANNAVDAVNDIDVSPGKCRATGDLGNIALGGGLTKQLDAVWAPGTGAGMRASGAAIADTTYHIFAIKRPDTGVVDVAADTSPLGANIAANTNVNYTLKRRIGSIMRVAGVITPFVQQGDIFYRKASVLDVALAGPALGAQLRLLSVPLGIKVEVIANIWAGSGGSGGSCYFSSPDQNDELPSATLTPLGSIYNNPNSGDAVGALRILTNTAAQVRFRPISAAADAVYRLATLGWVDRRGRDDL